MQLQKEKKKPKKQKIKKTEMTKPISFFSKTI